MNVPTVTVVLPTRERADVLLHSLRSLTRLDYPNLTILVVDNCSGDNTREVVQSVREPRIQYINSGRRLSMSHNWEFALDNVKTEWVCIVGDDDSLLPDSVSIAMDLAKKLGVEAIRGNNCNYYWPDRGLDGGFGRLTVPLGRGYEIRSSSAWLSKINRGDSGSYDLPCIYTGGFVKMDVMRDIKKKSGAYFLSRIPDIYSGIAVSSVIEKFCYSFRPLGIAGSSKHSNGQSQQVLSRSDVKDGDQRTLAAIEFNTEGEPIPYHSLIPLHDGNQIPPNGFVFALESYMQAAKLRVENDWCLQRHLALMLSMPDGNSLVEWGQKFAKIHNVSFEKARSSAKLFRARNSVRSTAELAHSSFRAVRIGSQQESIENVNDACAAAASIIARPPGSLATGWQSLLMGLNFVVKKLRKRTHSIAK